MKRDRQNENVSGSPPFQFSLFKDPVFELLYQQTIKLFSSTTYAFYLG
jgi:hypothetical protein